MLRLKNILHATDFSPFAEEALAHALAFAAGFEANLHVIHAIERVPHPLEEQGHVELLPQRAEEALRLWTEEHLSGLDPETRSLLSIRYQVGTGQPAATSILEYAEAHQSDMIVMGTHGRRGLPHWLLGSIAQEVVRRSPCPVFVTKPSESGSTLPTPLPEIKSILVPIDFSMYSGGALCYARELAEQLGAELSLLFVVEERVVPLFSDTGVPTFTTLSLDTGTDARARAALEQLYRGTEGPEVPATYHIVKGLPGQEILQFAKAHGSDLVVMATRGLSEKKRQYWLGSVAEKLIRQAPCPVLVSSSFGAYMATQLELEIEDEDFRVVTEG